MLFSDDIDEVLRAAMWLNTAREVREMDAIIGAARFPGARPTESQMRDSVEVAEQALELAVRVAAERSPPTWHEHIKTRDEIRRRRR